MTDAYLSAIFLSAAALAQPAVDAPAPAFAGPAASGVEISLEQFKGRTVVLEWTNDGCPFVKKHYESGNMQRTQASARADGAVWITVISSAKGKQGYADAVRATTLTADRGATPDFVLLDESGAVGRAYGAKTTPHMYVIDAAGTLRYAGAIDDRPSSDHASLEGATNYVTAALESLAAGRPVSPNSTPPYGCSVKYGS
jgi:peroxiredoxin